MTEVLLYASIKATLVLALAWVATSLLRRASADLRHRIWLAALVGTVLVALPLPVPAPVTIAIDAGFGDTSAVGSAPASAVPWVLMLWIIGLTVVFVRSAVGFVRLAKITRSARTSATAGLRISDAVTSPMTWGTIHPVILLPAYAMDWADEKLDVVLRHERAHIARRDWVWQSFAQVVTALFWFHPLAWFAASRVRQEAELATDDMVLASGSDAAGYADQLLEVARQMNGNVPHAAVAVTMVRSSALGARVEAILDSSRARSRAGVRANFTVVTVAVCLIALLAVCQRAHAQVYRVGDGVTIPIVIKRVQPSYSEQARRAKWQGTVTVSVVVDAGGHPRDIKVVKPLGMGLDQMAIEAVQQWLFKPAEKNGKPVPVEATIEIIFRLL